LRGLFSGRFSKPFRHARFQHVDALNRVPTTIASREFASVILRGAAVSFSIRISGALLAVAAQIVLARALPTSEYGAYAYVLQLCGILSVVASLGFLQTAVRVIPDMRVRGDRAALRTFVWWGIGTSLAVAALIAALVIAVGEIWEDAIVEPFRTALLPASVVLLASLTLLRFSQEILRAEKRVALSQLGEQIIIPLTLLAFGGAIWFFGTAANGQSAITFQAMASLFAGTTLIVIALRSTRRETDSEIVRNQRPNDWFRIGAPLAAAGLLTSFLSRGDVIVFGFLTGTEEIAAYAAAARITGLLIFGLGAVNAIGAPIFSELWHSGERGSLQTEMDRAASLATLVTLPAFIVLIAFPEQLLALFGPEFVEAANALRVLALGKLVTALVGPAAPMMVITGNQKLYFLITAASTVIMILSVIILEGAFGITGAAAGAAISIVFLNLFLAWLVHHLTGMRSIATVANIMTMIQSVKSTLTRRSEPGD
jgi:O-antigen/teichoic acid export membrane protein